MNFLKKKIDESTFESSNLYLLQKPSDDFGFFYQNGVVYFAKRSEEDLSSHSVDTSYLDMHLHVYITSEDSDNSFETGYYDMLSYKGKLDDPNFDVFYNVCCSYAKDVSGLGFSEFFNSLVELFKKNKEESSKKLIGLIGELFLIKKIFLDYEMDISENWHLVGSNSKFDFSFQNFNLEVKTTTGTEMEFLLKHSQIFNQQNNYISIISIIETGEDESVQSLVDFFTHTAPFSNNVRFQIAIQKEISRISQEKDKLRSFALDSIEIFDCKAMITIQDIPSCISEISYRYNFTDLEPIEISELFKF